MGLPTLGIVCNPIAGKGRGSERVALLRSALESRGYPVALFHCELSPISPEQLDDIDVLIIAGGDGTIQHHLPLLAQTQTAIYMLPCGNESLFARFFGMDGSIEQTLGALEAMQVQTHFLPSAEGRLFFTMLSIGLDSEVIREFAGSRSSTSSHLKYVLPTLRAMLKHRPPLIELTVDSQPVLWQQPGFLIIANTPEYALRLPWVPEASSTSGELAARFIPYRSIVSYLVWCLRCRFGLKKFAALPLYVGKECTIRVYSESAEPLRYPVQADGEFLNEIDTTKTVVVRAAARRLRVLVPIGRQ